MRLLLLAIVLCITGCGPKIFLSNEASAPIGRTLALLPIRAANDIPESRRDYIQQSLGAELASAGFVVLDKKIIGAVCSDTACSARMRLADKYPGLIFAELDLESASRANFIAGFYNTITGKLSFSDSDAKILASVENTEREKGGLLFNTGQIFQALKTQKDNSGDSSFSSLADRFVKGLVEKSPAPTAANMPASDNVVIASVSASTAGADQIRICLKSAPELMASLIIRNSRSSLREVSPGEYCGNFWIAALSPGEKLAVEARSPFGVSDRKYISYNAGRVCDLSGRVRVSYSGAERRVIIACTKTPDGNVAADGCAANIEECPSDNKLIVYRGPSAAGPFERVAEVRGATWSDARGGEANYQVVAKNSAGLRSIPVEAAKTGEK